MRKIGKLKRFVTGVTILAGCSLMSAPVNAEDNWPCEVALCISNPAGPMAVGECVNPIKKLYEHLAKGRGFPMCKSADGHVQFTRYGMEFQEDCPEGTRTVYRDDDEGHRSSRNMRMCEKFIPIKGGFSVGGAFSNGSNGGRNDNDDLPVFEYRMVNGERVYGQVVTEAAPIRAKPSYLDYVVQGDSRRLWW